MKSYPIIPKQVEKISAYAFAKLDGSNIRAEWSKKKGFWKFGSRKRLLGPDQGTIFKAEALIKEQEDAYARIARENRWERCIFFFEFLGPNSFAGFHDENDAHEVVLLDANPLRHGIIEPKEFVKKFESVKTAELLHHGSIDSTFVDQVKNGTLPGMPLEGVVCKAKNPRDSKLPIMFKIKSEAWLQRLKDFCKGDEKLFDELS